MNIFEQYGIKEVADVCLYSIELDENDEEIYIPVLYLDTLKVSTVEQTAEQVSARGGLGNAELIVWDYGKEITVTLEDALFSPASQSMMWGGKFGTKNFELYGTFLEKDVKIIVENFSNFEFIDKSEDGPYYQWDTKCKIISLDGEDQWLLPQVLRYYLNTNNWKIVNKNWIDILIGDADQDGHITDFDNTKVLQWSLNSSDTRITGKGLKSIALMAAAHATIGIEPLSKRFAKFMDYMTMSEKQLEAFAIKYKMNISTLIKNFVVGKYSYTDLVGGFVFDCEIDNNRSNMRPPQEAIYPVKDGLENVEYFERIEKCTAPQRFCIDTDTNMTHYQYSQLRKYDETELVVFIDPKTMKPYEPNTSYFNGSSGKTVGSKQGPVKYREIKQYEVYYKWTRTKAAENTSIGHQIVIDAVHYPGTYRLVGETYARHYDNGKDQRYQFEIPLCKMSSETNLTLQADGDPTTFNMSLKVLRREDGCMMKLTQYNVEKEIFDGIESNSTVPVKNARVE